MCRAIDIQETLRCLCKGIVTQESKANKCLLGLGLFQRPEFEKTYSRQTLKRDCSQQWLLRVGYKLL